MVTIIADVNFEDLPRFMGVFATRGAEARRRHGSRHSTVYRVEGEDRALIVFRWESREAFQGFLDDPNVKATMASSGSRPSRFTFVEEIATFPA